MAKDDKAAQKARAESLRREIDEIDSTQPDEKNSGAETSRARASDNMHKPEDAPPKESPRDFVQRRMRELNEKKK